jgi:hypothetical protein
MILYRRKSSPQKRSGTRLADEPYNVINIILAGVIVMVLAYSGILLFAFMKS